MRKYKHFILIALLSLLCLSFLPIRSEAVQEATEGMLTDSIRTISVGAFQNCNSLTDLFYAGTQKQLSQVQVYKDNDILISSQWRMTLQNTLISLWQQSGVLFLIQGSLYVAAIVVSFIIEYRQKKQFLRI